MLRGVQLFVSGMALAGITLAGASVASAQEPPAQPTTPAQPETPAQPAEPAAPVLTLDGDAAIITILIKPDKVADFETVLNKLKESLLKNTEKPVRQQQAAGWKVFKGQMAQGNAMYVFVIDPVVKGEEYDISRLIAEVFPTEVQALFELYKGAFAGRAISTMTTFMSMSQ
jgi:hypothetical protein